MCSLPFSSVKEKQVRLCEAPRRVPCWVVPSGGELLWLPLTVLVTQPCSDVRVQLVTPHECLSKFRVMATCE